MYQPKWLFILLLSSMLAACGGSSSSGRSSSSESSASSESSLASSSSDSSSSEATSSSSEAASSSSASSSEPTTDPTVFVCPETGLYFCDDFADGTADQWFLLSSPDNPEGEPNGTFDVVDDNGNNVLRFTAGSLGGELALIDVNAMDIPTADYYVEARIRPRENSSTSNKFLFLLARYQSEGNWYAGGLNVQNNTDSTKVEIAKSVDGSINRPVQAAREIVQGTAGELNGQWYTVRLELIDDTLTLYFNGEVIGSTTDGDYTGIGDIGLFTYNKSFEIDDVVIGDPANKPVQLTIDPPSNEWVAEAETDDYVVDVTAVQSNGDPDTFSVESSNPSVVGVNTNGDQVSLSPLAEGEAAITFTSGSEATLTRTINATITPAFVQPDAVYDLGDRTVPAVGGTDILSDTRIKLTFDDVPTLGSAGSARLYKASDDTAVDNISVAGETSSMHAASVVRTISADQIWVEGNTVVIAPHNGVLEAGTEYYVAIADGVIEGTLNGAEFVGLGKDAGWSFTTRVDAHSGTEVTVAETGEADFRTVQGALTYAMVELAKDDAVTINVMNGTYREPLYLRDKNNLTLRGESRDGTVIQFTNNNGMNPGTSERALFLVESSDMLVLENLTIENTTLIGEGGQAETIYFNSTGKRLVAKNAAFISEQDTLLLKGYSWFYQSLVAGNVDYIWGTADVALFEDSEIRTLGRSDGGSGGYILQARTADSVKGFVFLDSELTRGEGSAGHSVADDTYALARSGGSSSYYDNVVFVNTKMDDHIRPEGWHTNPTPNPATATATNGWREYNSMDLSGTPIDTSSWVSYQLSEAEYEAEFCNRAQIFSTFGTGGWDPFPEDTTDDSCTTVEEPDTVWDGASVRLGVPSETLGTLASGNIDEEAGDGSSVTFTVSNGKFESYSQSFYLVSQEVTGDFVLTAKLKSVGEPYPHPQFPVGLMMCECDTESGDTSPLASAGAYMSGSEWLTQYARVLEDGGNWGTNSGEFSVTPGDNLYLKLERVDNKYYTFYSMDGGVTYVSTGAGTFSDTNLPDTMKVGLFAAPYYVDQSFTFEDIQLVQ